MPGLVVSERLSDRGPIDLETVPFWASLTCHPALAGSCMTTPRCTFTCVIHSRFPGQSCSPVQQFWLFFPLSTRVYQAHAEGRGCLPFTREAGVAPHEFCGVVAIPLARYHLPAWICSYEDQTTLAAHPQPVRAVSSEQVADKACTGQVRAFAHTFGDSIPTADSASGGFSRQIPPLPVPITCSVKGGRNFVEQVVFEQFLLAASRFFARQDSAQSALRICFAPRTLFSGRLGYHQTRFTLTSQAFRWAGRVRTCAPELHRREQSFSAPYHA